MAALQNCVLLLDVMWYLWLSHTLIYACSQRRIRDW